MEIEFTGKYEKCCGDQFIQVKKWTVDDKHYTCVVTCKNCSFEHERLSVTRSKGKAPLWGGNVPKGVFKSKLELIFEVSGERPYADETSKWYRKWARATTPAPPRPKREWSAKD